jgi:imidazole glycerol-phosphate synthase subunit HisF
MKDQGLVKTINFKNPRYIGDPINTVKLFNEKEVDEIIVLDIESAKKNKNISYEFITDIVSESFMPLCYGGGIKSLDQISSIISCGIEKVSINTHAILYPEFIEKAAIKFGSSTIIVSIDIKKDFWGNRWVYINNGKIKTKYKASEFALIAQEMGAGELLVNDIDNDGIMQGYNINLFEEIANSVNIPLIACGGAGNLEHLKMAFEKNISAVAAGSMFVYNGIHRAVLINYPTYNELNSIM